MVQERAVDRRHGEEEARPLLGEDLPGSRRREGLRREHDRGARGERKVKARAEPVGEEELRGRVGDVVGAHAEDVAPVALDRVQDAPLHVDDGLRAAGGPRAVEPERRIVGMGRKRLPRGDRKSTRLNSSHGYISYAVFCLKKKKKHHSSNSAQTFRYTRPRSYAE